MSAFLGEVGSTLVRDVSTMAGDVSSTVEERRFRAA